MDHRKARKITWGLFIGGCAVSMISLATEDILWEIIGLICIITGLINQLIFFRCPHCRALMHDTIPFPEYCPYCGKKL